MLLLLLGNPRSNSGFVNRAGGLDRRPAEGREFLLMGLGGRRRRRILPRSRCRRTGRREDWTGAPGGGVRSYGAGAEALAGHRAGGCRRTAAWTGTGAVGRTGLRAVPGAIVKPRAGSGALAWTVVASPRPSWRRPSLAV